MATFFELEVALAACLETALAAGPNPPEEVCIVPGEDGRLLLSLGTAENLCCNGHAWVRMANVQPVVDPSNLNDQFGPCGVSVWGVTYELGVTRCFPFGDVQKGPTCDEKFAIAQQTAADELAMRKAICCFTPQLDSGRFAIGEYQPFGPDGGCVGGIRTVTAYVDDCACAEV